MIDKSKTETRREIIYDRDADSSVMMHIAFSESEAPNYTKVSLCIALYLTLALLWMPGFSINDRVYVAQDKAQQHRTRKVLRPPPEQPFERVVTKNKKARKVPMPDRTLDEPEPEVVFSEISAPEMTETSDWEIGVPDGPPMRETIAVLGDQGVQAPIFTKRVPPNYPHDGVQVRLQGYVILQAILRKTGLVENITVLRGLGKGKFGFEDEAIASLKQWQFLPGKVGGEPADVRMNLRVDFIIN